MAALTYQCPVDPSCPTSSRPMYCVNHKRTKLTQVRPAVVPPAPATTIQAPPKAAEAAPPTPPLVSVRLLGQDLPVPSGGLTLGRDSPACRDLPGMADLLQVSRTHARLYWEGGDLYVVDLNSTNGTFIDGQQVNLPEPLRPGQTLRLGQDVPVPVIQLELDEFGLPK